MAALCAMGVQAFFSFVYHVLPDVILMSCCVGWLVRQPWALDHSTAPASQNSKFSWGYGFVGALLALVTVVVSARDAAGWLALYPGFNFSRPAPEEQVLRYKRASALRPDFRVMAAMTKLMVQINHDVDEPLEQKKARLEEAIVWQEMAMRRCPDSYQESLNLALLYDAVGRFKEAEPLYEKVVDVLEPREMYYGSRYFFARHLASRANEVWRQRQPEKALVLFMRAKAEMAKCKAPFKEADPAVRLMIDKSIAFLQGANIQPEP